MTAPCVCLTGWFIIGFVCLSFIVWILTNVTLHEAQTAHTQVRSGSSYACWIIEGRRANMWFGDCVCLCELAWVSFCNLKDHSCLTVMFSPRENLKPPICFCHLYPLEFMFGWMWECLYMHDGISETSLKIFFLKIFLGSIVDIFDCTIDHNREINVLLWCCGSISNRSSA